MSEFVTNAVSKVYDVCTNADGLYKLKNGETTVIIDWTKLAAGEYETVEKQRNDITYSLTGVNGIYNDDGTVKQLSIGQMVMALCLQRASAVETEIISLMESISQNTADISAISLIYEKLAAAYDGKSSVSDFLEKSKGGYLTDDEYKQLQEYLSQGGHSTNYTYVSSTLHSVWGICNDVSCGETMTADQAKQFIDGMDTKLDSLNSLSQELLVELQSMTSKRDQSYDLVSALCKSFSTTLTTTASNLR